VIIGILEADVMDDDVQKRYGGYLDMFEKLLSAADAQLVFQTYQVKLHQYPHHINECDVYLITGSKSSCYEDVDWIHRLKQFVVECVEQEKKLLGICFGHQLIAHALGGRVQKSDKGWGIGLVSSDVTQTAHWIAPKQQQVNLLVFHQDQVTQLPPQASLVASNDFCPIASYHVDGSILTFQGHPEFNHDYLQYLMTIRRDIIGEQAYQQGMESLQQDEDNELVAQWIVNFIRG
jgi:GMP synthase-like glutamine amidotransferase